MNPSDLFDEFNSMTLDDFLPESLPLEQEGSASVASSYSDSFDELPIYRSLDVMSSHVTGLDSLSGIDMVYEPPALLRGSGSSVGSKVSVGQDDIFSALEFEFTNTSLPCITDPLGGIATTSIVIVSTLGALSSVIKTFLSCRNVHYDHCELSYLWKCQMTNFVDTCKFNIQIYSHDEEVQIDDESATYSVEFLRISGCSMLFSEEFREFKSSQNKDASMEKEQTARLEDVSDLAPLDLSKGQDALKSFVDWVSTDESEAVSAVIGIFDGNGSESPLLSSMRRNSGRSKQISEEVILSMTLLASICAQFKQKQESSSLACCSVLPLLSVVHLLTQTKENVIEATNSENVCRPLLDVLSTLIDSLIPATARLTAVSSRSRIRISSFERETASQMMSIINACA
jgi:hypothetical protein